MAVVPGTAGKRNRYVTIEQLTDSIGASGRPVESWATLTQAWMERDDLNRMGDTERLKAAQISARSDVNWTMAYQADMDPEAVNVPKVRRLRYEGRIYDITSATPIGYHDRIVLSTIANTKAAA